MLKLLLKKQMTEIFRNYFYDPKKNRTRSKVGIFGYMVLFVLLMAGMLGGMFTYLSLTVCTPFAAAGIDWLYFAIMGLIAVLLGTFGSVFNTYSCLYLSKDNDLLLSMPIPVNVLMFSRLLTVYLMGLMYSSVVIVPAVAVYWVKATLSPGVVLGGLLFILLISVFVLTLSCALGFVVAKISLKLKNKSFITVIISLGFFGAYYFFYFKSQTVIQKLIENAAVYGTKIKGSAYPLYLFGRVGTGDILAVISVSAVIFGLFAVIWTVISRSFLKIATASGNSSKRVYKEKSANQRSVFSALLAKEFGKFLSSPIYMLNCGLGILIMPLGGILLLWKGSGVISVLNSIFGERLGCTPLLLCASVCMLASMNDMAAPSVSLEGKNIWLMQSLPVTPLQVICAKLSVQLLLTAVPVVFCIVCMAIIYPYTAVELVLNALLLLSFVLFSALFGLFLGLNMPNLNWTSEITPIKQSLSVMIAMFGGFGYTILLCVGFMVLDGWKLGFTGYISLFSAVTVVLCGLIWLWIKKSGANRFARL